MNTSVEIYGVQTWCLQVTQNTKMDSQKYGQKLLDEQENSKSSTSLSSTYTQTHGKYLFSIDFYCSLFAFKREYLIKNHVKFLLTKNTENC